MNEDQLSNEFKKNVYLKPDEYLNGWARKCGWKATLVYDSLWRHADKNRNCFPSINLMAEEHGVSRDTIMRGLKTLIAYCLVKKETCRNKKGKFLHNAYTLNNKTKWKDVSKSPTATRVSKSPTAYIQVAHSDHKDTHIKDTHINTLKSITEREFGNQEINRLLDALKEKLGLPKLDESEKINRQYGWLTLKKFNGLENCLKLVGFAAADKWYRNNITSAKDLYYKGIKLIARKRGGGFIDARKHMDSQG